MAQTMGDASRKPGFWRKIGSWSWRLAIGVVLLLVASHTIWDRREGNRLAALLDEIAARGEPVTLAELNPTLPPQEMNGYFDLLKAFEIIFADTPALRAMEDYPETIIPPLTNRERSLLRNLLAERVATMRLIENPMVDLSGKPRLDPLRCYLMSPYLRHNAHASGRVLTDLLSVLHSPDLPTLRQRRAPLEQRRDAWGASYLKLPATVLTPSLERNSEIRHRLLADRRLAAVALAVHWHRSEHNGAWPESLEALVPRYLPAIPLDPMTAGGLIQYRAGQAPILWSAGSDSMDDGGDATPTKRFARDWDRRDRVVYLTIQPRVFEDSRTQYEFELRLDEPLPESPEPAEGVIAIPPVPAEGITANNPDFQQLGDFELLTWPPGTQTSREAFSILTHFGRNYPSWASPPQAIPDLSSALYTGRFTDPTGPWRFAIFDEAFVVVAPNGQPIWFERQDLPW